MMPEICSAETASQRQSRVSDTGARLQCAGEIHVPLKLVIIFPPRLGISAMRDEPAIHVEPAFVEEPGQHQVRFARNLRGVEFERGLIPIVPGVTLAIRMEDPLCLEIQIGAQLFPGGIGGRISPAACEPAVVRMPALLSLSATSDPMPAISVIG